MQKKTDSLANATNERSKKQFSQIDNNTNSLYYAEMSFIIVNASFVFTIITYNQKNLRQTGNFSSAKIEFYQ